VVERRRLVRRRGKTGRWRQEWGGGESSPQGKAVARVETSRVRGLPNGGAISARVKFGVDFLAREKGRNPSGCWAPKGGLIVNGNTFSGVAMVKPIPSCTLIASIICC
jgi:hypothetical protein